MQLGLRQSKQDSEAKWERGKRHYIEWREKNDLKLITKKGFQFGEKKTANVFYCCVLKTYLFVLINQIRELTQSK